MPPTSPNAPRRLYEGWRRVAGRPAVLVAVALALGLPLVGIVVGRGGSDGPGSSLAKPALVAAVGADRLALPDRASRSGWREEPMPPKAVTVVADGSSRAVFLSADTVGELLAAVGITLDGDDEVMPALDSAPEATVRVVRVDVRRVTEDRAIPRPKELRGDPAMPRGETRVEADGSPGLERVAFEVVRRDGRVVARRQISVETVTPAQPRVVYVGRGDGRGAPADEVPLKLRIAQGARQEGGASWYRYRRGTCAHRTLPKGTVVTVTNVASGKIATCTVADRGPFIAGRIIDLDHSVFMAIADSPGQGVVRVRIEW